MFLSEHVVGLLVCTSRSVSANSRISAHFSSTFCETQAAPISLIHRMIAMFVKVNAVYAPHFFLVSLEDDYRLKPNVKDAWELFKVVSDFVLSRIL